MTDKEKIAILKEALKYYADKTNWSIVEDYDGYIVEGLISYDDVEEPKRHPGAWSGYGHGGLRARRTLENIKFFEEPEDET